jgi:signal transduction histidine kinase
MRKILLCLTCLLIFGVVHAQNISPDSLIKLALLAEKGAINRPENPDSILKTLFLTKSAAARIQAVYNVILFGTGEMRFNRALYYHRKILEDAKKHKDPIIESVITGELGYTLAENGDYPAGYKMLLQALALAEKTGNKQAIGTVYDNLGVIYQGDHKTTMAYFKKALQYSIEGGDYFFQAAELGNMAKTYSDLRQPDSANYYLIKAISLAAQRKIAAVAEWAIIRFGYGQPDPKARISLIKKALGVGLFSRSDSRKSDPLALIAMAYQQLGTKDSALYYAKRAYAAAGDSYLSLRVGPTKILADAYKGRNADSALKYTEIYYQWRDSLVNIDKAQRAQTMAFAEQQHQQEIAAAKAAYQSTFRLYLLAAVIAFLVILILVFWRNNHRKQEANRLLSEQKEEIETQRDHLESTLSDLKTAQGQLIQAEKMASLGELTAGIAHEIQNPLNFVNNFSDVNREMLEELKAESEKPGVERDEQLEKELINDLIDNEQKINHHGKRADAIVKGMLQHSQASSGQKELTDLNSLADEYLRLSYHGLRAKDKSFNAELITHFDEELPKVKIIPQDIGRALLNLINNAFYATQQKAKTAHNGYKPAIEISTIQQNGSVMVSVKDNGNGIPGAIKEKIMQPFFTTKPTGEGTGLGLSLSYDIVVKGHGGTINVESQEGEGSEFTVTLPLN